MVSIKKITGLTPLVDVLMKYFYVDMRATPLLSSRFLLFISLENHDIIKTKHKALINSVLLICLQKHGIKI